MSYKDFSVASDCSNEVKVSWVELVHEPCGQALFGSDVKDPDSASLEELLFIAQAHRCPE